MDEEIVETQEEGGSSVIPVIMLVIMLLVIAFGVDVIFNDGSMTTNLTIRGDCNYVLPSNMGIETNGDKYVVAVYGGILGTEYLSYGMYDIKEYPPHISKPAFLWTECKARAFAKRYLKQQHKWDNSQFNKI